MSELTEVDISELDQPSTNISSIVEKTMTVVLAGGRGERLGELTELHAKPAIALGGSYRIIDFPLSNCVNSGLTRIGIATQYKSHSLNRHIQNAWNFLSPRMNEFVELWPAQQRTQDGWYSGTANAVYQNLDLIDPQAVKYVLVLAGDHVYKMDYRPMLNFHVRKGADLTLSTREVPIADAHRFGIVSTDEFQRVQKFLEKPERPETLAANGSMALASMGIYVFSVDFLRKILGHDANLKNSSHDFGHDILPRAVSGARVFAFTPARHVSESPEPQSRKNAAKHNQSSLFPDLCLDSDKDNYWQDVGTLDAYWRANMDLTGRFPKLDLFDPDWKIHGALSESAPASFMRDEEGHAGFAIDSVVAAGCRVRGAQIADSVLCTDVFVDSGCVVEASVLLPGARIGPKCRLHRAVVDNDCVVPGGVVVGENLLEDAERFSISAGGIVLVTAAGLAFDKAIEHSRKVA